MEDIFNEQQRILNVAKKISGISNKKINNGGWSGSHDKITEDNRTKYFVKKLREIQEQESEIENTDQDSVEPKSLKNNYDQKREEDKLENFLKDLNVFIDFIELKVTNDNIFWGGTVDGVIQFVYKVTPDDKNSGVEFNYLDGYDIENPENEKVVERLESYYDIFYKYWRNNVLQ